VGRSSLRLRILGAAWCSGSAGGRRLALPAFLAAGLLLLLLLLVARALLLLLSA